MHQNTKSDKAEVSTLKKGQDLEVGDDIEVQWGGNYRGIIVGFRDYEGNLKSVYPEGCRRVILEKDPKGFPVGNDEYIRFYGNKPVSLLDIPSKVGVNSAKNNAPESQEELNFPQPKRFFKCLGRNLLIGDVVEVGWSTNGDKIIGFRPYFGPLLKSLTCGAREAIFSDKKNCPPIMNETFYNVLSRKNEWDNREVHIINPPDTKSDKIITATYSHKDATAAPNKKVEIEVACYEA